MNASAVDRSYEAAARERKVVILTLAARRRNLTAEQVANLSDADRDAFAADVGCNPPSVTTWDMVVASVRGMARRDSLRAQPADPWEGMP